MTFAPRPPSVLVVEDDLMVLATLKVTLEYEHFEVVTCSSPIQALARVAERDFSVILSDHKMPEMMGLDFLLECRRRRPESSRILLTAVLNLGAVVDAIKRGDICRFIAKPWLRDELLSAIRDSVQRHDLILQNQALQAEATRLSEQLVEAHRALACRPAAMEQRA
jgi:DNA-binding NtrC family response regulator